MVKQNCGSCGKEFFQNSSSQITHLGSTLGRTDEQLCYNCALEKVTGGGCPEEGDFNSALLISGEISDQEWKWMQEDLRGSDNCQETEYEDDYDDSDQY